jgi:WD40 repeat protein
MCRRSFIFTIAVVSLLAACGPKSVEESLPNETSLPPATAMPVPATQTPTPELTSTESALLPGHLETIQFGNLTRLQLLKTFPAEMPLQKSAVAISPDGKTIAIGSNSIASILLIDLASGNLSRKMQINTQFNGPFDVIEFLSDGTLMVSSTKGYESYHIDANGDVLSTWGYPFAVSADGNTVAFGDNMGTTLVDIISHETLGSLEGNVVLSLSFSPDGSKLAVATAGVDYLTCYVWDVAGQTLLATLNEAEDIRFSPNGKFLVVTSHEGDLMNLKIFDSDGKTQFATLSDPQGLNGFAPLLSPDGLVIASQTPGERPVAWNTTNWQPLDMPALEGQLDLFSPDGRILITRASDGEILLWGVLP